MKIKLLIVANRCKWKSWDRKIADLKEWFNPICELDVMLQHTDIAHIPFTIYNGEEGNWGVDPDWYDRNISWRGIGSDVILFVLPVKQWRESNKKRGWRTDSEGGAVELQIACDEMEMMSWPNFKSMSAFFQLARHEIMHALFAITGQPDTTHYWWDRGELEQARDSIRFPGNWRLPILARALNFIERLISNIIVNEPPKKEMTETKKIIAWANAIKEFEGWNPGSLSYRNNNPGNLRYSPFEIGKNKNFSVFKTYDDGWKALLHQLQIAADGRSSVYKPGMSLLQFFKLYAPAHDDNDPDRYARFVADYIGVPPTTKIKELI